MKKYTIFKKTIGGGECALIMTVTVLIHCLVTKPSANMNI